MEVEITQIIPAVFTKTGKWVNKWYAICTKIQTKYHFFKNRIRQIKSLVLKANAKGFKSQLKLNHDLDLPITGVGIACTSPVIK